MKEYKSVKVDKETIKYSLVFGNNEVHTPATRQPPPPSPSSFASPYQAPLII